MEGEEGGGIRLSKRFSNDKGGGTEVDYKEKSGTAWSHSYLNQKPWHPLSYPNQRRKWIAEQTHANRQRRSEEVAREASSLLPLLPISQFPNSIVTLYLLPFLQYAQEQEFYRQTALISKKDKEKVPFCTLPFSSYLISLRGSNSVFTVLCSIFSLSLSLCVSRWSLCKLLALCMFVLLVTIPKVPRLRRLMIRGKKRRW